MVHLPMLLYWGEWTYDYQNKYSPMSISVLTVSSKFGVNNRWGVFPSFSLGWRLTGGGTL